MPQSELCEMRMLFGAAINAVERRVAELVAHIHRRGVQRFVQQQRVGVESAGHKVRDRMVEGDVRQRDGRDRGMVEHHTVRRQV